MQAIRDTLAETKWNRRIAATRLNISYKALLYMDPAIRNLVRAGAVCLGHLKTVSFYRGVHPCSITLLSI